MNQSNKILLEENLKNWLVSNGYPDDLKLYHYVLKLDISDTKELSSNMEQIINFWVLPANINITLKIRRVIDILVSGQNDIPIWIAIEVIGSQIHLTICKRYRKLKVIREWHKNNPFVPFLRKEDLKSEPNYYKEFHFLYPAGMYENQPLECDELNEIRNVMNLGNINYKLIEEKIWKNIDNENANILKINSKDYINQFILIDLCNCDQINVMNLYFRTNGAINEFVFRSLYRWNERLWRDGSPKVQEVEENQLQKLIEKGRNIMEIKTDNAV